MGPKYRPELDGLRAVAAFAVLLFHVQVPGFWGGSRGLDIFFVLSGYLVTGIIWRELAQTGRLHFGAFLKRRFLRLAPALYMVIAANLILTPLLTPQISRYVWQDALYAATYLRAYASYPQNAQSVIAHTWSLSIEMQFYLLWPLLLIGAHRLGRRWTATLCVVAWAVLTGWRLRLDAAGASYAEIYFPPHMHVTGLLLGSAMALAPLRFRFGWLGLPMLGLLICSTDAPALGVPLAELSTVLVLCSPPAFLGLAPLAFLGRISYGIYLWHFPLWHWLGEPLGWPGAAFVAPLSVALGALSFRFIEQPLMRWRRAEPNASALRAPSSA